MENVFIVEMEKTVKHLNLREIINAGKWTIYHFEVKWENMSRINFTTLVEWFQIHLSNYKINNIKHNSNI